MDRTPDLEHLCTSATIRVEPWEDDLVETHGFDVRSSYVEATGAVAIFKSRQCFAVTVPEAVK
jgi:hypothetical protein